MCTNNSSIQSIFDEKLGAELDNYIGKNAKEPDNYLDFLLMIGGVHPAKSDMDKVRIEMKNYIGNTQRGIIRTTMKKWVFLVWSYSDNECRDSVINCGDLFDEIIVMLRDGDVDSAYTLLWKKIDVVSRRLNESNKYNKQSETEYKFMSGLQNIIRNIEEISEDDLIRLREFYRIITAFLIGSKSKSLPFKKQLVDK